VARLGLLAALVLASGARAADELTDNLLGELTFGNSNTNAVAGHGRLTAAVSVDGDLSVLAWPGPGFGDQIAYFASNDPEARRLPHFGALDGMGSRLGLFVTTAAGTSLTWLRDWTFEQGYTRPDAAVPVTRFTRGDIGLTVTVTDAILPAADVLSRNLRVERAAGSPVTAAALALYENLSPTLSRIPQVPIADWALPTRNDFAAAWDEDARAILHFHPGDRAVVRSLGDVLGGGADPDYGALGELMKGTPSAAAVAAAVRALDATPGVAALVTTEPAPAQLQVGTDATPFCGLVAQMVDNIQALPARFPGIKLPIDPAAVQLLRCTDPIPGLRSRLGWTWAPKDALADLGSGQLSGSLLAAGQTNGALVAPLTFVAGVAEGAALFAFGATRAQARSALEAARGMTMAARQSAAEEATAALFASAALPDPALGQRVRDVALRSLVNIQVAREAATGGVVASVSRQPPYHLDWPRDGAFIDAALDLAGRRDQVDQRLRWYAGLARAEPTLGDPLLTPQAPVDPDTGERIFPAGVWEMNYFPDGAPGGPLRFEIDNTALHVWSIAAHVPGRELLAELWPSTRAALDVLVRWRSKSGLPAPANEDDHADFTSTLHGAVTVFAGLVAGERLARAQGDGPAAARYAARTAELRGALLDAYFDGATGLLRSERDGAPRAIGGAAAWFVWPGRVFAAGDARLERILSAEMDRVLSALNGEGPGAGYLPKVVVAAALYGREGGARSKARQAVLRLADMATPGTLHFGEIFEVKDGKFTQRVATPHVWEGALFYLAAMALTAPEKFNAEERALPLPSSGCGCRSSGGAPWAALFVAALLSRKRKR